jgi:HEAT repeat protein
MLFGLVAVALRAAPLAAKPKKNGKNGNPVKEAAAQITKALAKNDATATRAALSHAESLRESFDDKKLAPIARAIGKGVKHKDEQIAISAIETLGKLKIRGSGKLLGKLISPPSKVKDEKVGLHQTAIRAAGSIHDPETLKTLEKLLLHANTDIATTSAEALVGYKVLDLKPKEALLKRLVAALAKLEKTATSKKDDVRDRAEKVGSAVAATLTGLTGKESLTKSAEWKAWLKEQSKRS